MIRVADVRDLKGLGKALGDDVVHIYVSGPPCVDIAGSNINREVCAASSSAPSTETTRRAPRRSRTSRARRTRASRSSSPAASPTCAAARRKRGKRSSR